MLTKEKENNSFERIGLYGAEERYQKKREKGTLKYQKLYEFNSLKRKKNYD